MKKIVFILVFFFFLTTQAIADVSVNILKGKAVGEKKAALFLSVLDDAGRPIKGLSEGDLRLFVGGREIENFTLEPVSTTQESLSIILGIDVSGSMRGRPFNETKNAISIFLDQLDRDDFICLLSFGTEVKFLTDFTKAKHKVREQINRLKPIENYTHLYDATYEAIKKGKEKSLTTRTAVILLTDGKPTGRQERSRQEAVNIAIGAFIPVFTIGFGHEIDRTYLEEIAAVSKGYFLFTPEPERIAELYSKVLDQLKNQYMISFNFENEPGNYRAKIILTNKQGPGEANREFFFSPKEKLSMFIDEVEKQLKTQLEDQAQKQARAIDGVKKEIQKKWYTRLTWREWLIIAAVLLAFVILFSYLIKIWIGRNPHTPDLYKEIIETIKKSQKSTKEWELEFPEEFPTPVEYLTSKSSTNTKLNKDNPNIFLKIGTKGEIIPLVYKGVEIMDEFIIAARKRETFKKKGVVYLWILKNELVSGPKEGKAGHANVSFLTESERFALEDLGSVNGTLFNGKEIKGQGRVPLQDGDVIDIGGKKGISIIYRESEQDKESYEETTIAEI